MTDENVYYVEFKDGECFMKIVRFVILTILLFQPLTAKEGINFSVAPKFELGFGHTTYTMDNIYGTDSTGAIVGELKSELKFPLDATYAGFEVEIYREKADSKLWFVDVAYSKNINNPRGVMTDGDWLTPTGGFDFLWSYTESDVEYKYDMFSAHAGYRIYKWTKSNTFVVVGYKYQRVVQDVINIRGWQYDFDQDPLVKVNIDTTIHALYYKVVYHQPSIGLLYDLHFTPRQQLQLSVGYMHVFASDNDDHILRNKLSEASGTGPGFYSSLELNYHFQPPHHAMRPFIGFDADFSYLKVSTGQTQTWYGDDPITDGEDDTGHIERNIPHRFTSLQFFIGLRAGVAF